MVQAIVSISKKANHILNIVKAKYELKDKSSAIEKMAEEYEKLLLEPQLRPEYIEKLKRIEREKSIDIKDVDAYFIDLQKR